MRHSALVLSALLITAPVSAADMPQPPGIQEFSYSGAGLGRMSRGKFIFVMSRIQAQCARTIIMKVGGDTTSPVKMRICMNEASREHKLGIVARELKPQSRM